MAVLSHLRNITLINLVFTHTFLSCSFSFTLLLLSRSFNHFLSLILSHFSLSFTLFPPSLSLSYQLKASFVTVIVCQIKVKILVRTKHDTLKHRTRHFRTFVAKPFNITNFFNIYNILLKDKTYLSLLCTFITCNFCVTKIGSHTPLLTFLT